MFNARQHVGTDKILSAVEALVIDEVEKALVGYLSTIFDDPRGGRAKQYMKDYFSLESDAAKKETRYRDNKTKTLIAKVIVEKRGVEVAYQVKSRYLTPEDADGEN